MPVFFFVRGGLKDLFEDISWFSYEHLEKCQAIFVIANSVGIFDGESCGDAVFLVPS
jgi:hypothetical protein